MFSSLQLLSVPHLPDPVRRPLPFVYPPLMTPPPDRGRAAVGGAQAAVDTAAAARAATAGGRDFHRYWGSYPDTYAVPDHTVLPALRSWVSCLGA